MEGTNIVNKDGSLKALSFRCLKTGNAYMIIATANQHASAKFWEDSAFKAVDTLKRVKDGAIKSYTRADLEKRFKNVKTLKTEWV